VDAEAVLDGVRASRMQQLYTRFAPRAGHLAYLLVGDREAADDITQEAFVRAFGRLSLLRDPDSFGSYLRTTVVNLTRKHWRRASIEKRYLARERATAAPRHVDLPDIPEHRDVVCALRSLPHDQRAAIILRFFEDLSERDAAAVLGCRPGTVKSRVSRGLEALRIDMRGEGA
jgi:RNA polymerase sigma-70 factor (sigma-E family)